MESSDEKSDPETNDVFNGVDGSHDDVAPISDVSTVIFTTCFSFLCVWYMISSFCHLFSLHFFFFAAAPSI